MIVYYAIGGGLGHVTRARRVLRALGLAGQAVIVASDDPGQGVTGGIPLIVAPRELEGDRGAHRAWIAALGAERIIADAFPLGIRGELAGLDVPLDYVARLLRWDAYRRAVPAPLPRFGTTYLVEPIAHAVESDRTVELRLVADDGPASLAPLAAYWLVVHSGPAEEVEELVAYARELQGIEGHTTPLLVATRCDVALPPGVTAIDAAPASPLFARAARIVSAAGFNVMLETEPYRDKHHVLPMPRRFDDQFARAALTRDAGAARAKAR